MEIELINCSKAKFTIDSKIYNIDVIHKCFYWYGAKYSVDIKTEGSYFVIYLSELSNEGKIEIIFDKIKNDLIDFKTRDIVSKETMNIRDLLTAKAFSNGEYDETPSNDPNDPVGIKFD